MAQYGYQISYNKGLKTRPEDRETPVQIDLLSEIKIRPFESFHNIHQRFTTHIWGPKIYKDFRRGRKFRNFGRKFRLCPIFHCSRRFSTMFLAC